MNPFKLLKSLAFILCTALSLGAQPGHAQGTIPLAMAQQVDINGQPLAGCLLYFYQAGTVNLPQNAFVDFGLTSALPNPVNCDQTGRIPMFWLANGLIHVRLTDANGLQIIDTTMQVLGPSSGGGGGGGTVDPTTILSTGDLKVKYGTGPLTGFVRFNGLNIGNATSGATERANSDTQAAFIYLYGADPNLVVAPGGRSGNALNDYNANKTIALPDWRGRALAALDDMGNTAAGRLTSPYFGTAATVLGAAGGSQNIALSLAQLPTGITSNNGSQAITVAAGGFVPSATTPGGNGTSGGGGTVAPTNGGGFNWVSSFSGNNGISVTSNNTSGAAHPTVMPAMLTTFYMKL